MKNIIVGQSGGPTAVINEEVSTELSPKDLHIRTRSVTSMA